MDFSDSDGEIPEIDLSIRIQSYMFEPVCQNNDPQGDISPTSDDSDNQSDDQMPEEDIFEDAPNEQT